MSLIGIGLLICGFMMGWTTGTIVHSHLLINKMSPETKRSFKKDLEN